jgi:hypothetical protein
MGKHEESENQWKNQLEHGRISFKSAVDGG